MVGNNPNSLTVASPISRLSNIPTDKAPKFIRSKDRCHIIVRTPIYDAKGNLLAYNFRYTAGEGSFRPDELQRKHVKHAPSYRAVYSGQCFGNDRVAIKP